MPTKPKGRQGENLLRELQDYNAPPAISDSDAASADSENDAPATSAQREPLLPSVLPEAKFQGYRLWNTRSSIRSDSARARGEHLTTLNLNVEPLLNDQPSGVPSTESAAPKPEQRQKSKQSHSATGKQKRKGDIGNRKGEKDNTSKTAGTKRTGVPNTSRQSEAQESEAIDLFATWQSSHTRIEELLATPRYSSWSPSEGHIFRPESLPRGIDLQIEDGLYVFKPTAAVFRDFERFLKVVEDLSGRKTGIVKVIVPAECIRECSSNAGTEDAVTDVSVAGSAVLPGQESTHPPSGPYLQTFSVTTPPHPKAEHGLLHRVVQAPHSFRSARAWRKIIDDHRQSLVDGWSLRPDEQRDPWYSVRFSELMTETEMLATFSSSGPSALYAIGHPATNSLRQALHCDDLTLSSLPGNSMRKVAEADGNFPDAQFNVSNTFGSAHRLQLEEYAAYSINYLHVGAPRCWTVIRPQDYGKVEGLVIDFLGKSAIFGVDKNGLEGLRMPQCSHFLRRRNLYVPELTLQAAGLEFTRAIQYQGELVIVFPFAYHQGFNTGPNIAEAMPYGTERWETFLKEGLFQQCSLFQCDSQSFNRTFTFANPTAQRSPSGTMTRSTRSNPSFSQTDARSTSSQSLSGQSLNKIYLPSSGRRVLWKGKKSKEDGNGKGIGRAEDDSSDGYEGDGVFSDDADAPEGGKKRTRLRSNIVPTPKKPIKLPRISSNLSKSDHASGRLGEAESRSPQHSGDTTEPPRAESSAGPASHGHPTRSISGFVSINLTGL